MVRHLRMGAAADARPSCQVRRHALSERGDDLYETPPVAVEALLRHERLPHRLWDPAAGPATSSMYCVLPVTR